MDKMALDLEKEKNAVQAECDRLKKQNSAYVFCPFFILYNTNLVI